MRPLCLIVHAAAGGGRAGARLPAVLAALERRDAPVRVARTEGLAHATALAREATARGEVAVAFGGDGLTGALTAGVGRTVDVAEVDGRTFLGIASFGLDSRVGRIANRSRIRGRATYLAATVRALARWCAAELGFAADGGPSRTILGFSVAACSSGVFGGGMRLAPQASLADGLLDVVVVHDAPRARFLALLPRVFDGSHVALPEVELFRARELRVHARPAFPIYAEGDPIGATATIRAVPAALRVLVP